MSQDLLIELMFVRFKTVGTNAVGVLPRTGILIDEIGKLTLAKVKGGGKPVVVQINGQKH